MPKLQARKISVVDRVVLALVFTISFATYFAPDLSVGLQIAPLALFAALVLYKVLWSDSLLTALMSFLETDSLVYIVFLSALMLESSFGSNFRESYQFALLLSGCLVLARLYMAMTPLKEVLEGFYWSAVFSLLIFLPLSFGMFIHSLMTFERLMPFNFHPNLLALQFSGFLCVMIWKVVTGSWPLKILSSILGAFCALGIFLTSSRGAIVGVAAGCVFAIGIGFSQAVKRQRTKIIKGTVLGLALLAAGSLYLQRLDSAKDAYDAVDQILSLSSSDRGIDSGMTGRVDMWREALRVFKDGTWLFGHGVRSSDVVYTYPMIDNSYLVLLYDMGLVPLILIAWRFISISRNIVRNCSRTADQEWRRLYVASGVFLVVLLVTGLVERSLFAVGNPFSLLAFLFFAAPTRLLRMRESDGIRSMHTAALIQNRLAPNM